MTRYLRKNRFLRKVFRSLRGLTYGYPNWRKYYSIKDIVVEQNLRKQSDHPKILVATSVGAFLPGTTIESLITVALKIRGNEVHVLLCDSALTACQECDIRFFQNNITDFIKYGPKKEYCSTCFKYANRMYESIGIKIHKISEYITNKDLIFIDKVLSTIDSDQIKDYVYDGMAVGEHAYAGTLRFFAKGTLDDEEFAVPILLRYFKAALIMTCATKNLFNKIKFDSAVFHHGIYVPQGIIGEVCRKFGIRVINWNPAYRKNCFIFSHGGTYHHTLMNEPTSNWENIKLTNQIDNKITSYLKSRWEGSKDWISFHKNPEFNLNSLTKEIGIDFSKPTIGLLTNVIWDAQLHYPQNAFHSMMEWLIETINYFSIRSDLQLLIRVHPAEITGFIPSRQKVVDELYKYFKELPFNIFIISPADNISTYSLMNMCNSVIIYGTKTGVELTSLGIPVIVAGEAWIRNKGITVDASTKEEYFNILSQLPMAGRLDELIIDRAKTYAYHFFFRRMIFLDKVKPKSGWPPFQIDIKNIQELLPGNSVGLDVICDGIIKGSEFIYPDESSLII